MTNDYVDPEMWLHVYAQYMQHSEAHVQGTRKALTALRDAIDVALATGRDAFTESVYTADGEGYKVRVTIRNYLYLQTKDMPYYAVFAGGVGQRCFTQELEQQEKTRALIEASKNVPVAQTGEQPT